ncbi:hypothetical protein D3C86_1794940 [compost metagenome]
MRTAKSIASKLEYWLFSMREISNRLLMMRFKVSRFRSETAILSIPSSLMDSLLSRFSNRFWRIEIGVSSSWETFAINCFSFLNCSWIRFIISFSPLSSNIKSEVVVCTLEWSNNSGSLIKLIFLSIIF